MYKCTLRCISSLYLDPSCRVSRTRDQVLFAIAQMKVSLANLVGQGTSSTTSQTTLERASNKSLEEVTNLAREVQSLVLDCQSGDTSKCTKLVEVQALLKETSDDFVQGFISTESIKPTDNYEDDLSALRLAITQAETELADFNTASTGAVSTDTTTAQETIEHQSAIFEWIEDKTSLRETRKEIDLKNQFDIRPFLFQKISPDEDCDNCYRAFHEIIPEKVTAKLYFLGMERTWFDPTVFQKEFLRKVWSKNAIKCLVHMRKNTHTHTHTHTHTNTHTHTHTHTHSHTQCHTYMGVHKHPHPHMHTQLYIN